jgi:hypothetical protein
MERVTVRHVRRLAERIGTPAEQGGRAEQELVRRELRAMDHRGGFSTEARCLFQDLLGRWGVATPHPIHLPLSDEPFWFRSGRPLAGYQSRHGLPDTADVVVIGAGLTGASALVDVSIKVHGQPQLLGRLGPGSIFGEVSLIDGEPRTTSCSIRRHAVLAQLGREACERLLNGRVAVALKFLAVLNRGLIAALRSADRQLMQLNADGRGKWNGTGITP